MILGHSSYASTELLLYREAREKLLQASGYSWPTNPSKHSFTCTSFQDTLFSTDCELVTTELMANRNLQLQFTRMIGSCTLLLTSLSVSIQFSHRPCHLHVICGCVTKCLFFCSVRQTFKCPRLLKVVLIWHTQALVLSILGLRTICV